MPILNNINDRTIAIIIIAKWLDDIDIAGSFRVIIKLKGKDKKLDLKYNFNFIYFAL